MLPAFVFPIIFWSLVLRQSRPTEQQRSCFQHWHRFTEFVSASNRSPTLYVSSLYYFLCHLEAHGGVRSKAFISDGVPNLCYYEHCTLVLEMAALVPGGPPAYAFAWCSAWCIVRLDIPLIVAHVIDDASTVRSRNITVLR